MIWYCRYRLCWYEEEASMGQTIKIALQNGFDIKPVVSWLFMGLLPALLLWSFVNVGFHYACSMLDRAWLYAGMPYRCYGLADGLEIAISPLIFVYQIRVGPGSCGVVCVSLGIERGWHLVGATSWMARCTLVWYWLALGMGWLVMLHFWGFERADKKILMR